MGVAVKFANEKTVRPGSGSSHYMCDLSLFSVREVEDLKIAAKAVNVCEIDHFRKNRNFHEQIDLILASQLLKRSPVLIRLLAYLFSETVAGRGPLLKSYTVAVDALGRSASFDATIDSYPRVQIARLRKVLEAYYASEGAAFDPCIHIPLGSYAIELAPRLIAYPNLAPVAPAILVEPAADRPSAAIEPAAPGSSAERGRRRIVGFALALVTVAELVAAVPIVRAWQTNAAGCATQIAGKTA